MHDLVKLVNILCIFHLGRWDVPYNDKNGI